MPSTLRPILYLTWIIAALASAPHSALAEDPAAQKLVPSLIVMNAQGASLQGGTLTLNGVAPSTIVFADRPVRAAGHMLTAHVLEVGTQRTKGSPRTHLMPPSLSLAKATQRSMTLSSF